PGPGGGARLPAWAFAGPGTAGSRTLRRRSQASRACCVIAPREPAFIQYALWYTLRSSADEKLKVDSSGYGSTFPLSSSAPPIIVGTYAFPPTKWWLKWIRVGPSIAAGPCNGAIECPRSYS